MKIYAVVCNRYSKSTFQDVIFITWPPASHKLENLQNTPTQCLYRQMYVM